MKEGDFMGFEESIKRADAEKKVSQSNDFNTKPTFVKRTIDLGKGMPVCYQQYDGVGRPTYESDEDIIEGDILND